MRDPLVIEHVAVRGYRALLDQEVRLGNLSVLIGPNGSGKSTFLDIFALLSEAAQGALARGIASRGGITRLATLDQPSKIRLALTTAPSMPASGSEEVLSYSIELESTGSGFAFALREQLLTRSSAASEFSASLWSENGAVRIPGAAGVASRSVPNASESALSQLPELPPAAGRMRSYLRSASRITPIDTQDRSPIRLPQTLQPTGFVPSANGDNLFSVLMKIRGEREASYGQVEEVLRAAFPTFRRLDFPAVASGQVTLAWHDSAFTKPFYVNELSSGTLRFLLLVTVLLSPEPPEMILIDEPEVSFHPEMLRLLAELLRSAAAKTQIVAATQSATLLRWLRPEDVIVVDKEQGVSTLTRGDELDLDEWLKTYALDQLWAMNVLGGRS